MTVDISVYAENGQIENPADLKSPHFYKGIEIENFPT